MNAEDWYRLGLDREKKKEIDAALQDYEQALRLKSNFPEALAARGNMLLFKGDTNGALRDYTAAIGLKPDYVLAFNNRGNAYFDKGDLDGAEADYNEAILLDHKYSSAFYNRGNVYRLKQRWNDALRDYSEAISLDPDYADAFNNRGVVRQEQGNLDGALSDYTEAIRLMPTMAEAFNCRSNVHRLRGELEAAQADHQEAARLGFKYNDVPPNVPTKTDRATAPSEPGKPESDPSERLRLLSKRRQQLTVIEEADSVLGSRSYPAKIRAVCHSQEEQRFNYWAPREVVDSLDQVLRYKAQLLATEPITKEQMLERSRKLQLVNWSLMDNVGMSAECVSTLENGSSTVPSDDEERAKLREARRNLAQIDQELLRKFPLQPPMPTIRQIAEAAAKWGPHWPDHVKR